MIITSFRAIALEAASFSGARALRLDVLVTPFGIDPAEATRDDEKAHHFGLFDREECLAVLLLCPREQGILQMRQVAVRPTSQRKGLGRKLVMLSEEWAINLGYQLIWANIRKSAEPFYRGLDYQLGTETYELVGLPHRRAEKQLVTGLGRLP